MNSLSRLVGSINCVEQDVTHAIDQVLILVQRVGRSMTVPSDSLNRSDLKSLTFRVAGIHPPAARKRNSGCFQSPLTLTETANSIASYQGISCQRLGGRFTEFSCGLNCGQLIFPTADGSPCAAESGPQTTSAVEFPETLGAERIYVGRGTLSSVSV